MKLTEQIFEANKHAIKKVKLYCEQNDLKLGKKCPHIEFTGKILVDAFLSGMVEGSHAFLLSPDIALTYFRGIYKSLLQKEQSK